MPSIKTLTMALAATTVTASPLSLTKLRRQESTEATATTARALDFDLRSICSAIPSQIEAISGSSEDSSSSEGSPSDGDDAVGQLGAQLIEVLVDFTGASPEDVKADIVDAAEKLTDSCFELADLLDGLTAGGDVDGEQSLDG
jgi:hypothetical protein